jgi:hypothetical protein
MAAISRASLMTLETYAKSRTEFRAKVIAHKKCRTVHLGAHVTLLFEDELTIRYQVQEMLRMERIFEEAGIQDELDAYNPLVPDGSNWKASMLIEYEDAAERACELRALIGIEDRVWVKVNGFNKVYAIADQDIDRDNEDKTASVHFLCFELKPEMISAVLGGADVAMGVDHQNYQVTLAKIDPAIREALAADLRA